jgi:Ca2+-binding EF-hand superfamily protein
LDVNREDLDRNLNKLIKEAFRLHIEGSSDHITLEKLEEVLHQCGAELEEDELRVLANECADKKNKRIYYHQFYDAIKELKHDVSLPPQSVVGTVLRDYLQEKNLGSEDTISYYELTQFFDKHHRHLLQNDVLDFLHEVKYLASTDYTLKVDEVASLIRDDVEMFAR